MFCINIVLDCGYSLELPRGSSNEYLHPVLRDGRVVRRCWVNFQCWGVQLIWIIVGQGPIVLAVGAGGGCLDIFSLVHHFSSLSPSLWETARYRLKYCLKGPLSPKQPTNQHTSGFEQKYQNTVSPYTLSPPHQQFVKEPCFTRSIQKFKCRSI